MASMYIAYYRDCADCQDKSSLGLDTQREAVRAFLANDGWPPAQEFTEVESGKMTARPQLAAALAACRRTDAILIVAKLDRLARNIQFLLDLVEGSSAAGVQFCDLPHLPAGPVGTFMLQQMAAVAQLEAGLISKRTKAALAAVKARGTKLGGYRGGPPPDTTLGQAARARKADTFAANVAPVAQQLQAEGGSLRTIAVELTARGIPSPRGGVWSPQAVKNLLARFDRCKTDV